MEDGTKIASSRIYLGKMIRNELIKQQVIALPTLDAQEDS